MTIKTATKPSTSGAAEAIVNFSGVNPDLDTTLGIIVPTEEEQGISWIKVAAIGLGGVAAGMATLYAARAYNGHIRNKVNQAMDAHYQGTPTVVAVRHVA